MNNICNWFVDYLIEKTIIDKCKKEIYLYGLKLALYKVVYALIILSMCFILKRSFFNLLLFYFSYMSIRKYSGGYHAPNIQTCMSIFGITYYVLDWFIILLLSVNKLLIIILSVSLIFLVYIKSPRDCENKRLNEKEKIEYKKQTLFVSIFWLLVAIVLIAVNSSCYLTIFYTYFSIFVFLLI